VVSKKERIRKQRTILKKELFKIFHTFSSTHSAKSDTGFRHMKAFVWRIFLFPFLHNKERYITPITHERH